jgi:SprB repeat/CHU_C Type IX secretion signal domain
MLNNMSKTIILYLSIFLGSIGIAVAQPTNDDCNTPTPIPDVTNFCSAESGFSTTGATPSSYSPPNCFTPGTGNDVWFSFVATATDVTITIRGATQSAPGGSLQDPQIALYYGTCGGTISELECQAAPGNSNVVEAYQGGLFVGSTYLVRIQGGGNQTGTFQLCINNYNPPVDPQSDCPDAAILCDKSSFTVQTIVGAGSNISELVDATCFSNGAPGNYETNSTWFVWTCSQSGSLEFTLTPNNGPDDLDFVVYRLPNGIGNCNGKQLLRCMASGESGGVNSAPCLGKTGLRSGENDTSEDAGCSDNGDNAWLSPLDMVQGETYALVVNNFSATGNGFSIEFGGSGQFLGPTADFSTVPAAICIGTPIVINDQSTFPIGQITSRQWSFGAESVPQTATGTGPHTVSFTTPGIHPVVMTLTTDLGCKVTQIKNVTIFPDVEVDTIVGIPDCNGGTNGSITIDNITSGTPAYQFSWNNGPFSNQNTLTGLTQGSYSLRIRDANNCETDFTIPVRELELTVSPVVTVPLCNGDANGEITLNVTNGTGPFQFNWGAGFVNNNTQGGYAAGVYTILGQDVELCKGTFTVTVTDNPPVSLTATKIDVTCFGAADGVGMADPVGGVGNFSYLWTGGQTGAEAENLPPGTYTVTASDANGCSETATIAIVEPPELDITLLGTKDLLCNGVPTGEIDVMGNGGRAPYEYSANGTDYQPASPLTQLLGGSYWVKVRDASGCIDSVEATLVQPPPVTVIALPADTMIQLGFTVLTNTVTGPAGRVVTYEWTPALGLDCTDCPAPLITGISDQWYIVKVTDGDGCIGLDTVKVTVKKERPIYFPNIFDPQTGTFPNNFFTGFSGPAASNMKVLRVFDRWGSLVFEGNNIPLNDPNRGWDGRVKGRLGDTGVYTWYATVAFIDGVEILYDGNITLIR